MRRLVFWAGLVLAGVLAAAGCGGAAQGLPADRATGGAVGGGGAAGGGDDGGGHGGVGAPVKIPSYQQRGLPRDYDVEQSILSTWRDACGDGTVCVHLVYAVVAGRTPSYPDQCAIVAPYPHGTVRRGATVTYHVDSPCRPNASPGGAGPSDVVEPSGGERVEPSSEPEVSP